MSLLLPKKMGTFLLLVSMVLLLAGCLGLKDPSRLTPVEAGINPSRVIDPHAHSHDGQLLDVQDLYQSGEEIKGSRRLPVRPPKKSILVLSGGGSYGAYSAGLLVGWSEMGTRPEFDVINGVSVGALVGGMVFAGRELDQELTKFFTTLSTHDIYHRKGPIKALLSESFADSSPLKRQIERIVTPGYLECVARAHESGRRFYVGTSDLDAKRQVIWDMGAIAAQRTEASQKLYRLVLLASASIPGLFPPVHIPVQIDGKSYQERHVDGAVTSSLFARSTEIPHGVQMKRTEYLQGSDLFIVVAGKLYPDPAPGGKISLTIVGNSVGALSYAQTRDETFKLYSACILTGLNYHSSSIPQNFKVDNMPTTFDPKEMGRLFQEGRRQIQSGTAWRRTPPGYEPGEYPGIRAGNRFVTESPQAK